MTQNGLTEICQETMVKKSKKSEAVDPNAFRGTASAVVVTMQSECTKCGAHSVNAVQAQQNKTAARKSRKSIIKESNRKSN